jgi:hypothetical protein
MIKHHPLRQNHAQIVFSKQRRQRRRMYVIGEDSKSFLGAAGIMSEYGVKSSPNCRRSRTSLFAKVRCESKLIFCHLASLTFHHHEEGPKTGNM